MDDSAVDQSGLPDSLLYEHGACAEAVFNAHTILRPSVLKHHNLMSAVERYIINGIVNRTPLEWGVHKVMYGDLVAKFKGTPIGKSLYLTSTGVCLHLDDC